MGVPLKNSKSREVFGKVIHWHLFLILIAAEGSAGLVCKAAEVDRFKAFGVSLAISFSILQFADDNFDL